MAARIILTSSAQDYQFDKDLIVAVRKYWLRGNGGLGSDSGDWNSGGGGAGFVMGEISVGDWPTIFMGAATTHLNVHLPIDGKGQPVSILSWSNEEGVYQSGLILESGGNGESNGFGGIGGVPSIDDWNTITNQLQGGQGAEGQDTVFSGGGGGAASDLTDGMAADAEQGGSITPGSIPLFDGEAGDNGSTDGSTGLGGNGGGTGLCVLDFILRIPLDLSCQVFDADQVIDDTSDFFAITGLGNHGLLQVGVDTDYQSTDVPANSTLQYSLDTSDWGSLYEWISFAQSPIDYLPTEDFTIAWCSKSNGLTPVNSMQPIFGDDDAMFGCGARIYLTDTHVVVEDDNSTVICNLPHGVDIREWHRYVVRNTTGYLCLDVDGLSKGSQPSALFVNSLHLNVIGKECLDGVWFDGNIMGFKAWSKMLMEEELAADALIYGFGYVPPETSGKCSNLLLFLSKGY